jgi:tetratricopeptide (TPR) repeat protein
MHVESVAWVTELKDLLFSVFYLASMIFYVRYMQEREGNRKFFVLSLVCFVLSLFSKIQAVSLPLSLFLLDYFFERRFNFRSVMEKVPFLVLSLVFGIGGLLLIGDEGALNSGGTHDLLQRVFMGTYALSAYIIKFFIPLHLSALYPIRVTAGGTLPLLYYLSPIFLLATGYFVYRSAKHTRAIVFGSLFFLVNIMFLLQIVSVGTAFMADRFTYIPYLGLAFVAAWALEKTIARGVKMIYTLTGSVVVVVVIFIALGFDRCKDWKNGETLWTDVIRKYPTESSRPYSNRSVLYNEKGQWDLSIADCSKAISINPDDAHAYSNRSVAFANKGEWSNALSDCNRAIGIDPRFANAFTNRGNAYLGLRDWRNAVADYNAAIRINPNEGNAYANCGVAYGNMEEWNKAVDCLSKAITIDPKNVKAYSNRGWVFVSLKKPDKALADYSSAIGIDPGYATAYFNRGTVYGDLGNWDKAIADYSKAIEIDPQMQVAYKNREIAYRYVTGNR